MISDYEKGKRRLSPSMAQRIATILTIEVDRISQSRNGNPPRPLFYPMSDFLGPAPGVHFRISGSTPFLSTPARDIPENAALLGLTIKAPLSHALFAAIDYGCTMTEAGESTDHRFNAELRIRF